MPRWAALLLAAVVLGLLAVLLPLPGLVGTLIYVAASICAAAGLIFLFLDLAGSDRRPMR